MNHADSAAQKTDLNDEKGFHSASAPFYAALFSALRSYDLTLKSLDQATQSQNHIQSASYNLLQLQGYIDQIISNHEIGTLTLVSGSKVDLSLKRMYSFNKRGGSYVQKRWFPPHGWTENPYPFEFGLRTSEDLSRAFFDQSVQDLRQSFGWTQRVNSAAVVLTGSPNTYTPGTPIPLTIWADPRSGVINVNVRTFHKEQAIIGIRIIDPKGNRVIL